MQTLLLKEMLSNVVVLAMFHWGKIQELFKVKAWLVVKKNYLKI